MKKRHRKKLLKKDAAYVLWVAKAKFGFKHWQIALLEEARLMKICDSSRIINDAKKYQKEKGEKNEIWSSNDRTNRQ